MPVFIEGLFADGYQHLSHTPYYKCQHQGNHGEREEDARRIRELLPKRFGRFELELHPEKTRLVDFRKPRLEEHKGNGTFDFLGFTHYWGKSRKKKWVVMRKTAKEQDRLIRMVRGHYAYYGITGNIRALSQFYYAICIRWQNWLKRRSSGRHLCWDRFKCLLERYPLPRPRIVHSALRLAANP